MDITIEEALARIRPPDAAAMEKAGKKQARLLKPEGSLGTLEEIAVRMTGITGQQANELNKKRHLLFGADNGVYAEGVSTAPQQMTARLVEVYANRKGGCIDTLCEKLRIELCIYDLGVKGLEPLSGVDASHKLMEDGTGNIACEKAMPARVARAAVELGINLVKEAEKDGVSIIGTGEVGMANTTTAAACIMACLGGYDPALVGYGAGLSEAAFEKKKSVIKKALILHNLTKEDKADDTYEADPLTVLSSVGGLDIAAMTGVFIGAAAYRLPVIIDGAISAAAALLSTRFSPLTKEYMFASHISAEPAYQAAADALGVKPFLSLGMRLGEGSGCPLAMQIMDDALLLANHMAEQ
ncbi:MAG: nicotinate-nucleotide--dimethylbenzimidazole phosphoribosyltransferase [Lachnospiraceae bacterium]|nr:nicotinate-nucleotide--dimethylbenzimidazole phosphoribosyltransferase [Lachnospiraceae bacterium]